MIDYNKDEIKEELTLENIFDLLNTFGGNPEYSSFGILSDTICHNPPNEGSRKLYFYENSMLFRCYTECDCYFDIYELVRKVADIQWHEDYDLNDAVRWIANYFHINGVYVEEDTHKMEDYKQLSEWERISTIKVNKGQPEVVLKTYDPTVLKNLDYKIKIDPWLKEGISDEVLKLSNIGFYPGGDQITIPHYDKMGRFIGLRGRTVVAEEAEYYGKYRPLKINNLIYRHPLGMNLYNFNHSQNHIKDMKKVFVFESEKSCLLYRSYFGTENDISVACCGFSLSNYQINMLRDTGAEIIIAFDRQFQEKNDKEFYRLVDKFKKMKLKYGNSMPISFIIDKNELTGYKDSPIDCGKDIFLQLYKERVV